MHKVEFSDDRPESSERRERCQIGTTGIIFGERRPFALYDHNHSACAGKWGLGTGPPTSKCANVALLPCLPEFPGLVVNPGFVRFPNWGNMSIPEQSDGLQKCYPSDRDYSAHQEFPLRHFLIGSRFLHSSQV